MKRQPKPQPTPEQFAALRTFAAANGRTWKDKLRHCWATGLYNNYSGTEDSASLQRVRNTLGPSWLVRFQLRMPDAPARDAATATGMYDHD